MRSITKAVRRLTVGVAEFDTILAALRLWEASLEIPGHIPLALREIAREHGTSLDSREVGALCERLNFR